MGERRHKAGLLVGGMAEHRALRGSRAPPGDHVSGSPRSQRSRLEAGCGTRDGEHTEGSGVMRHRCHRRRFLRADHSQIQLSLWLTQCCELLSGGGG